jgi:hypothetical protein
MFGIVPVLFSANIGMLESIDGVVLLLRETVAGLRRYIDRVDRGVRGLDGDNPLTKQKHHGRSTAG